MIEPPNTSKPGKSPHIAVLALACAIGPLAMNVYLPALPSITAHFNASEAAGQLSLSLYLASMAVIQLISGPLSDKFGRRPVMLGLISLMLVATLVCIFAPTMEVFLIGRILQASAAAGIVLSRAIVRDMVSGDKAASMIGYVTMGMTIAPMTGPAIGGVLEDVFNWQATLWFLFVFAAIALAILWVNLNETNQTKGAKFRDQFEAWPQIVTSRRFWGYSACVAFSSGGFFALLGGAPLLAVQYYGLSPTQFGLYFFFVAVGYMAGNYLAGRFSTRIGLNSMMLLGNVIATLGLLSGLFLTYIFPLEAAAIFIPMFFLGVGNGVTLPNANAGIVRVRPAIAGAASGLGAFLQLAGGAAISALAGFFISPTAGPQPLVLLIITTLICAIVSTVYVIHIDRLMSNQNTENA